MMRIVQEFKKEELNQILHQFYSYFNTGFEFEDFLKPFLEKLGLSEVVVTKKTGDGGIDLKAVKNGLVEINNEDSVRYKIQAKRLSPDTRVPPEKIDALRGNLLFNEKGLFITTGRISENSKEQAVSKDPSKPVFVIDGIDLMRICIEKQIGFAYRPEFSESAMKEFSGRETIPAPSEEATAAPDLQWVEKTITQNDIRVNILSIPRFIADMIEHNDKKHDMSVQVNGKLFTFTFSPARKYLYVPRATNFWKDFGLLESDGTVVEKKAEWAIDDSQNIYLRVL